MLCSIKNDKLKILCVDLAKRCLTRGRPQNNIITILTIYSLDWLPAHRSVVALDPHFPD